MIMNDISKDETLDLNTLLQSDSENDESAAATPASSEKVEELTPAEKMVRDRETQGSGMVVSKQDLVDGNEKKLKNPIDSDERLDDYAEQSNEMSRLTGARVYLVLKNKPTNDLENYEMMEELSDMKEEELRKLQARYPNGAPLKSKYFDLASVSETAGIIGKELEKAQTPNPKETKAEKSEDTVIEDAPSSGVMEIDEPRTVQVTEGPENEERKNTVKLLIDKTGFGVPVELTEIEKEKILMADQIDVVEVENLDLSTIKISKPAQSFVETIGKYEYQGVQIPMAFPCSRMRATMMGLSYGEMADIAMAYDNSTYESERKKLTIIYNKMKNITTGPFETFDDFLDGFAYADIDLATYGLYLASCAEKDTIYLRCGKKTCEKGFNAPFISRSLLDMNRCSDVFLRVMKELLEANGEKAKELRKESPIFSQKAIKLPISGWIVKIGMMTCRDWLEGVMRNGEVEQFKQDHPDDVNGILYQNILFFQTVRAIYVPDNRGGYTEYTNYTDILEALYVMNPDDFQMLGSIMNKYTGDYTVHFSVKDVTCPHCKTKTDSVEVSIDNMVFRAYQRRVSTTVNLGKLRDF